MYTTMPSLKQQRSQSQASRVFVRVDLEQRDDTVLILAPSASPKTEPWKA